MKKLTLFILAFALAISADSWPGLNQQVYARDGRGGGRDFRGGGRGDFRGFRGGHGHGGFSADIWVGPGWWWDPFFYPYYPAYPYYSAPPVVIQQQPEQYVAPAPQSEEQSYWYYCRESKTYYPYVKKCPGGWMKVVPTPAPPDEEE